MTLEESQDSDAEGKRESLELNHEEHEEKLRMKDLKEKRSKSVI